MPLPLAVRSRHGTSRRAPGRSSADGRASLDLVCISRSSAKTCHSGTGDQGRRPGLSESQACR